MGVLGCISVTRASCPCLLYVKDACVFLLITPNQLIQISKNMKNLKSRFSKHIKEIGYKIDLNVGEVTLNKQVLGQGGNGVVYSGDIHSKTLAFKFLLSETTKDKKKIREKRFFAEYFNVMLLSDSSGLVKYIGFDILPLNDEYGSLEVPIIIMKKYNHSLKELEGENAVNKFKTIFNFLLKTVDKIHKQGIIHRDLKPQNILVHNNEYAIADFGIASYNPEIFHLRAITQKGERLANRLFSAPEQEKTGVEPKETMDIYAIGQILHWLIFSETHRGTNRKQISSKIEELGFYDRIIDKCLRNDPKERYQNINEIYVDIKENEHAVQKFRKEKQRIERANIIRKHMMSFENVLIENFPKNENGIIHSNNLKRIDGLFNALKVKEIEFEEPLWFIDHRGTTDFKFTQKGEGVWKLNNYEYNVIEIWINYFFPYFYNDFIIVHYEKGEPFNVNNNEQYDRILVDGKWDITDSEYENRFAEVDDKVINLQEHEIEIIRRPMEEGYLIISTRSHCALWWENKRIVMSFLKKLKQENGKLDIEYLKVFENEIRQNKSEIVEDFF